METLNKVMLDVLNSQIVALTEHKSYQQDLLRKYKKQLLSIIETVDTIYGRYELEGASSDTDTALIQKAVDEAREFLRLYGQAHE